MLAQGSTGSVHGNRQRAEIVVAERHPSFTSSRSSVRPTWRRTALLCALHANVGIPVGIRHRVFRYLSCQDR